MTSPMRFGLPGGHGELGALGEPGAGEPSSNREAVRTAERLGFDSVWFTDEPALADDAATWRTRRSAFVLATVAAAATGRIRLGVAVTAAQLASPVRLAADLATLDVVSGGRVTLVVGADAPAAALDRIRACWAGEPVTVDGARHVVEPLPVARPPVFVAAGDDASVVRAARAGHGLILPATHSDAAVRHALDLFAANGGDPDGARVERFCLVGESDAEARRLGGPHLARLADYLLVTASVTASVTEETVIAGGPDTVAARIAALREQTGARCVTVRPSLRGHCPFALQRVTVDLFATEVVPRLSDRRP